MNGCSRTCARFGAGLRQSIGSSTGTFRGGSLTAGPGFVRGDGMLTYQGKTRAFQVHGLSAAGVGADTSRGTAEVYHLP